MPAPSLSIDQPAGILTQELPRSQPDMQNGRPDTRSRRHRRPRHGMTVRSTPVRLLHCKDMECAPLFRHSIRH